MFLLLSELMLQRFNIVLIFMGKENFQKKWSSLSLPLQMGIIYVDIASIQRILTQNDIMR